MFAEDFVNARALSLKLFLVYWTYRREIMTAQGVESMNANGVVNLTQYGRTTWGQINLEYSELKPPGLRTIFNVGSLWSLLDLLRPEKGEAVPGVTMHILNDEDFLWYSTVVGACSTVSEFAPLRRYNPPWPTPFLLAQSG
jgi:hypothetical protein